MVEKEIQKLLNRITYKPELKIKLLSLANLYFPQPLMIVFNYSVLDSYGSGKTVEVEMVKVVDEFLLNDEDMFFHFIQGCIREIELHEADEWLRVDGKIYDDPHKRKRR